MDSFKFQIFCVETYSAHIAKPINVIYSTFKETGLLDLLKTNYLDLHGLGSEALSHFFDEYMQAHSQCLFTTKAFNTSNEFTSVRAIVIPEIIRLISEKYNVSLEAAMDMFYNSKTALDYENDETGYYGYSPLHIFTIFVKEQEEK